MTNSPAHVRKHTRPVHPPFTHFPIAAYVFAAGFDVISVIGGHRHAWADQLWHAGTFVLVGGLAVCLVTMLTGFADLIRFGERRPEAVRTLATHVCIMAAVFMIAVGDIALRISDSHQSSTPPAVLILTVAAAVGVCTGGFFGGTLVYRHGTGVAAPFVETHPQSAPALAQSARTHARSTGAHPQSTPAHPQSAPADVPDLPTQAVRHDVLRHRAERG